MAAATPSSVIVVCSAIATTLIGLIVLLGWRTGSESMMAVLPGHIRMKPNAALGFVAAGLGLALTLYRSPTARQATRTIAVGLFGLGGLTLVEYFGRIDLHFDQLLFHDPVQHTFPGRMAHISAANFCLAGIALFLVSGGPRARRLAQLVSLALITFAFAAMVGYL